MNENFSHILSTRSLVNLITEPSGLAVSLVEKLIGQMCRVNIVSVNNEEWGNHLDHLLKNKYFSLTSIESFSDDDQLYNIFISLLLSKLPNFDKQNIEELETKRIKFIKQKISGARLLIILPRESMGQEEDVLDLYGNDLPHINENQKIIFVSQLFGKRMLLTDRDKTSRIIKSLVVKDLLTVSKNTYFRPLYIEDIADEIVHALFSLSSQSENKAFMGPKISSNEIYETLLKLNPSESFLSNNLVKVIKARTKWSKSLGSKTQVLHNLESTAEWIKKNQERTFLEKDIPKPEIKSVEKYSAKKIKTPSLRINKIINYQQFLVKLGKYWRVSLGTFKRFWLRRKGKPKTSKRRLVFILLAIVIFLPYIAAMFPIVTLIVSRERLKRGNIDQAKSLMTVTKRMGNSVQEIYYFIDQWPIVKKFYVFGDFVNHFVVATADIGTESLDVLGKSLLLSQKILNQKTSTTINNQELSVSLDSLYKKASFLENDLENAPTMFRRVLDNFGGLENVKNAREKIYILNKIVNNLEDIIAMDGNKRYLVLLQNNMELRPTGGFIGSFGVAEFDHGAMIDFDVFDVYSADGQLKGYVTPPKPIQEYLGEETWYLRDSNWNPDFAESAKTAEWFLDKEIGIRVDGVIAIDVEFIKRMLKVAGPIYLTDFDKEITENSLYEIIQYEAEKDFFPGSRRKENVLTSLSSELLLRLKDLSPQKLFTLTEEIYNNLNQRHVQVYFHQRGLAELFNELNWDGSISPRKCLEENCYADYLAVIEANLGVNKVNYFVDRNLTLKISVSGSEILRELNLNFTNEASSLLIDKMRYKNYLRLVTPPNVEFAEIRVINAEGDERIIPDTKLISGLTETGFLVDINPGQTVRVSVKWKSTGNLSFRQNGVYQLSLRKQAGVDSIDSEFSFRFPGNIRIGTEPIEMLTEGGVFKYNTSLSQDAVFNFYW